MAVEFALIRGYNLRIVRNARFTARLKTGHFCEEVYCVTTPKKKRARLIEMLSALEAQLRAADRLAKVLERDLQTSTFGDYMAFRRNVDEMRSLSAIIELKLEDFDTFSDTPVDDLRRQFFTLDVIVIKMLIRCAANFFTAQAQRQGLPLGVSDLLPGEIEVFRDIGERLKRVLNGQDVGDSLFLQIDQLIALIAELQERAPSLPDFSQEPSAAEWLGGQPRLKRLATRH